MSFKCPGAFLLALVILVASGAEQDEDEEKAVYENQDWEEDFGNVTSGSPMEARHAKNYKEYDPERPNTVLVVSPPKRGRFFPSLFSMVKFPRITCMAAVGLTGTCFTKKQCSAVGGIIYGPCARGYGVCCVVRRSCGTIGGLNRTYFANPEYPAPSRVTYPTGCTLTMTRPSRPRICQVRLDFNEFLLVPPRNGDCLQDRFLVNGQSVNSVVPPLCGLNIGQHMYFDLDESHLPFTLTVLSTGDGQRRWNIGINFIECQSRNRAPSNCLQYFTGTQGLISSFNFIPGTPPSASGGYLNNLDYSLCFRKEPGFCIQRYSVRQDGSENRQPYFDILNTNNNNAPSVGPSTAGVGYSECLDDYLLLAGLRFCGTRLNPDIVTTNPSTDAPVYDFGTGPLYARFVSNREVNSGGFQLSFTQLPCPLGGLMAAQQTGLGLGFGFPSGLATLPAFPPNFPLQLGPVKPFPGGFIKPLPGGFIKPGLG